MKIFTYGTLLPGLERHHALETARPLGPAMVSAQLHDLGSFPGVKPSSSNVTGEVFEVDEQTLHQLDRIEGFDPKHEGESLFLRKSIDARMLSSGEVIQTQTYFAGRAMHGDAIPHGDYRRYRLEQASTDTQWVLSYGSNMGRARLEERFDKLGEPLGDAVRGYAEGFELIFNKASGLGSTAFANMRFCGGDAQCPGVAYALTRRQVAQLDGCEGVRDGHYIRMGALFSGDVWSEPRVVQVYLAHPNRLVDDRLVADDYFDFILAGYREFGFETEKLFLQRPKS